MKDFQMILELKELLIKTFQGSKDIFPTRPYDTIIVAGLIRVYKSKTRAKTLNIFLKHWIKTSLDDLYKDNFKVVLQNHKGFICFKEVALHCMNETKRIKDVSK
ncbi:MULTISPECIES: hypothetical protein [unclassified Campylobacter]|uniref:hypothetical protein n=1 Tax=unclassified Campylobacter TaxID=2593542 RepID=UPI001EFC0098|nr:hypothetical protein [Campylobacter sp. RM12651]MBZ7976736.1 hypothetical protein [Campylobacter sp. RM12637]ULO02895.1 hypothetical protein AVBRAN_0425 [Campylobacter sp. RM12651]